MFFPWFKKNLTINLDQQKQKLFMTFEMKKRRVRTVELKENSLNLDNKYRIKEDKYREILNFIKTNKLGIEKGSILFNLNVFPEMVWLFRESNLKLKLPDDFKEYKFYDFTNPSIIIKVDYFFDFKPNVGIEKTPAVLVKRKEEDVFMYGTEIVDIIPKDRVEFYKYNWIKDIPERRFLGLSENDFKELERRKKTDFFLEMTNKFVRNIHIYNKKQLGENIKKCTETVLDLISFIKFEDDKLIAKIKPAVLWSNTFDRGKIIDYDIKLIKDKSFKGFINDYNIFRFREYRINEVIDKLKNLGFKRSSYDTLYLDDMEQIADVVWKLKKHKQIQGLNFKVDETIQSLSVSDDEVESLVSVKLDEGKSLIYLDVDYYHKNRKIDSKIILHAIQNKQSRIKIDKSILKINYKNFKQINEKLTINKVLPLEKFYMAFELTRLSKRKQFSEGYTNFFKYISEKKQLPKYSLPDNLKDEILIHEYQALGFEWLSFLAEKALNGILADEMGLGKTLQALLVVFNSKFFLKKCNLIVCPKSLVENWRSEILKFFNFDNIIIHYGNERNKFIRKDIWGGKIVITTYEILKIDLKEFLKLDINYLIIDEAQRIKNTETQTAKALKILGSKVKHKIALTGTPIENRLSELWSIFDFLMPGFWGTKSEFRNMYEIPIVKNGDKKALSELHAIEKPFVLRRTVDEVLKLPQLISGEKFCDLFDEQLKIYEKLLRSPRFRKIIAGIKKDEILPTSTLVLVLLQKLRMVCSHPGLITKNNKDGTRSGKMTLLFHDLDNVLSNKNNNVLIFIEFRRNFIFIEKWLKERGIRYVSMHGGTTVSARQKAIMDFEEGMAQVFLIGLKVGGFGLNLTRANYIFLFDRWWNPAVEQQAVARAHRIGQKRAVTAYRFVTKGTIEERLEELHKKKKELFKNVFETEKLYKKLSKEEILRLLEEPSKEARLDK